VRISRPLIGTAIGAGALGATLALGVTMASASASAASSAGTSHSAKTATSATATPKPAQGSGHKCPGMSGSRPAQRSMAQG
jgi:predicted dinucleotide-binding enzyme